MSPLAFLFFFLIEILCSVCLLPLIFLYDLKWKNVFSHYYFFCQNIVKFYFICYKVQTYDARDCTLNLALKKYNLEIEIIIQSSIMYYSSDLKFKIWHSFRMPQDINQHEVVNLVLQHAAENSSLNPLTLSNT